MFREEKLDGKVSYYDVDRVVTIDQDGGRWTSAWAEELCKEYIPEITMPYMPSGEKIEIHVIELTYDPEKNPPYFRELGTYNTIYIDRIVFPDGRTVNVGKAYHDGASRPAPLTDDEINEILETLKRGR